MIVVYPAAASVSVTGAVCLYDVLSYPCHNKSSTKNDKHSFQCRKGRMQVGRKSLVLRPAWALPYTRTMARSAQVGCKQSWCPPHHERHDGGCTSRNKFRWAAARTAPTSASLSATATVVLSAAANVVVASESVWGKWGRRWRRTMSLASDAASGTALIERKSRHLLHHLMLVLMDLLVDGPVFGCTGPFAGTSWQP